MFRGAGTGDEADNPTALPNRSWLGNQKSLSTIFYTLFLDVGGDNVG